MIRQDEQETTITYDSGEKLVRIYSARPSDINKLRKQGIKPINGTPSKGYFYIVPMERLFWKIRKPKEDRPRKPSPVGLARYRKGIPGGDVGC